jgi:plastocyanin
MSDALDTEQRPDEAEEQEAPGPRVPGFAYPLLAVLFGGVLVWSFSRILLAVSKEAAAAIALLTALNILVASALIAYGRRVRGRPVAFPFLVAAGALLVGAGVVAAVAFGDRGPQEAEARAGAPQAVTLEATGLKFAETRLTLRAGATVRMTFENRDRGIEHNFVLFPGPTPSGQPLFRGDLVNGPGRTVYTFNAPTRPGTYFFHCEIHPTQMTGTVTVTPAGGGQAAPGAPAGAVQITARGTAFVQTRVTAPAGGRVTIHFTNDDPLPHNVAIFEGTDATGKLVFRGKIVTGPGRSVDESFPAPPPGTYFFHCDVHPTQMQGTITFVGGG